MKDSSQTSVKSPTASLPSLPAWRRHFTRQRLRAFVLLSVAVHLILGMSWGVPAYVKQKRLEAEQRRQQALLEEQQKASAAALAKAKAGDLAKTIQDVQDHTHKAFNNLTAELPQADKEKTWNTVHPAVKPAEQQLATALGDRSMTEQDLRNLQANVDRDLVEAVNDTLSVDAGRQEVESFLASVEARVVPELIAHYKAELVGKVAQPVKAAADDFVKREGTDASAAVGDDASRKKIGDALRHLGDEADAASGEVEQAETLAARKPPAADDEIHQHVSAATTHLTGASSAAADGAAADLAALVEHAKPVTGGSQMVDRLNITTDSLSRVRDELKATNADLAANDSAGAAKHLIALVLTQRKLAAQWASASDAAGQARPRAEQIARGSLSLVEDNPIPQHVDGDLADAFHDKALTRLTDLLVKALRTRLAAAGIKPDDALVASTGTRLKELLASKVGGAGGYGTSTSQALREAAVKQAAGAEGERLAAKFTGAAEPVIKAGVLEVVTDTSLDARLAEMVSKPGTDSGRDDVRDRVAMLAAQAKDGRSSTLDSVSLTDLRASAMARSSNTDHAAADNSAAPDTEPAVAEGPPVIDELKKEILDSLHKELQKVFDGKLPDDKAAKVWDQVAAANDADVNHLARDLIDPNVSDSELENRRLAFSGKFLGSVREALDKTASQDVAKELINELQGKAGDAVAGVYRKAVKENVGGALGREWRAAADADGAKAAEQARGVRDALDSAQAVAEKAAQVLDHVKTETAQAARDGKGNPAAVHDALETARGKLAEVGSAIAGSKSDVDKAQKDVPAEAAVVKDKLAEVGKSFDAVAASLNDADKTGKAGDAGTFTKAVADARKEVEKVREGLSHGRADLDRQAAEARAQFIKGAEQASADGADKTPGVKSRVESKFEGEFHKEALPRLTDQIVKDYQKKLEQAGVATDAKDADGLRQAVTAALDKKVTGETRAGEAALDDLQRQKFFDGAKNAKAGPTTQQADRANEIADKVADAGVAASVKGDAAGETARNALKNVAGPDAGVFDVKDKVARMEGQLRGGRGGVLAGDADAAPDAKDDAAGLAGMRRKWRGILAGLDGDGDGNGAKGKGKATGAVAAAAGGNSGGAAGNGAGAGAGPGVRRGAGPGRGGEEEYRDGRYRGDGYGIDKKLRDELIAVVKDRAKQGGENWGRDGADGNAARARDLDLNRPASILAPATQPAQLAKNDTPYTPTFKSLRFAVVPYLNKPITINDNFDAWADVPALHLRPQLTWSGNAATLKILDDMPVKVAWDNHGLYFMYDMTIPEAELAHKNHMAEFWACDCLEVFMDTMNTKEFQRGNGAGQQFWFWPFGSLDDADGPGGESFYTRQKGFNFVALKTDELQRFGRRTPHGYQMQCRIPIERVRDADLTPGKIVGFNITIETGGKIHYYWSASKLAGTSYHPDTWGDILLGGSDGKMEFPEKLAADAGNEPVKDLNAFALGEPLLIRVTDHDMNLNEKVKDKVSVTVRNPRGEQEVAILEETGRDTGIFEGSVRTALSLGEKVPGVVSAYEGEALTVTYIDQARANGARNVEVISKITAGPSVMVGK